MLNHTQLARTDINLLLVFDLLMEERNAGRVAARLHLTPSAISHSLKRLRIALNDPLFLPSARGMIPTATAEALAPAVRDVVERVSALIGAAEPFNCATAVRRFRIGAPDGAVSVVVPSLVRRLRESAPGIDLSLVQLLPRPGAVGPEHAWQEALGDLDAGRIDVAILPHVPQQRRFQARALYSEDFVIAARRGHPMKGKMSVKKLTAASHVLVSATGDTSGFVDALLAERGLQRRVALTVPSFFMAVAAIAASDLVGALPRRFAMEAARTFALQLIEPPFLMGSADLNAITPRVAVSDQGLAWLVETIAEALADTAHASPSAH